MLKIQALRQDQPGANWFAFSGGRKPPSLATRVSVFFRSFIAKITLTLLADSEQKPPCFDVLFAGLRFLILPLLRHHQAGSGPAAGGYCTECTDCGY
ncbi:MAG: hypothetical protein ACI802_001221 [Candidatus Paceibacteria bacterium]|jgi:hypothetical protein